MKIVLDTNILVKACKGSYHANRLLAACLQGKFTPFFLVSVVLLAEYEDIPARESLFYDDKLSLAERNELLEELS